MKSAHRGIVMTTWLFVSGTAAVFVQKRWRENYVYLAEKVILFAILFLP